MIDPETCVFEDDGGIPNSRLPVLIYHVEAAAFGLHLQGGI